MAKFEDYLSPAILEKMRKTGEVSDIDRIANKYIKGESLNPEEIDLLNKDPSRLQKVLKPESPISLEKITPSSKTGFQLGSSKDLSSTIDSNAERLRNALKSQPGELVGTPYIPKSKFDQLVERLEPSMKMSSETPDISAKLSALETPETGFQLGESKDLSTRINPTEKRLRNALKSQSGEMVGTSYTPKSKFDQLIERLEPSMKMSSETPDISAKLSALETPVVEKLAEQEIEKLSSAVPKVSPVVSSVAPEVSAIAQEAPIVSKLAEGVNKTSKLDGLMGKFSSLSDEALASLGPIGQKILANKYVSKGLPLLGLITEGADIVPSYKKGKYLDTTADVLGAGASGLALTGVGSPAAAIMGGGSLALHGLSALKENSDIGGAFSDLQKKGTSPYQLARGGDYGTEADVQKFNNDQQKQKEEINNLNEKADSVSPLSEKELSNLQASNSSSLPPGGLKIPYPMLVPQNKKLVSTTEDLKTEPTTKGQAPVSEDLKESPSGIQAPSQLQQYQDMLNLQQKMSESSVDALRKAQEEAKQERGLAALHQAANQILGGTLGLRYKTASPDVTGVNQFWKERSKNAGQVVEDLKQRSEREKDDPNSEISIAMRKIAEPMLKNIGPGIELPKNMSYNAIQNNFPMFTKMFDAQTLSKKQEQLHKEQQEEKQKTLEAKISSQVNNRYDKNVKEEVNRLGSAKKVEDMLNEIKNGRLVDSSNIRVTLTDDLKALALPTGVRSSVADRAKAAIDNLHTRAKDLETFLTAYPQKTIPPAFLKQIEIETKILKDAYAEALAIKTKSMMAGENSEIGKNIIRDRTSSYFDEYNYDGESLLQKKSNKEGDQTKKPLTSEKDEVAIQWAKDHINSKKPDEVSDAKAIFQRNGIEI